MLWIYIITIIFPTKMSKDDYTGEIKELAEKVLHGLLATNKTSELKQHFNNIEVISGTV